MILVEELKARDLPEAQKLASLYDCGMSIDDLCFGSNDLALCAKINEKLVGFLWAGLMADGKLAYVDKFVVHPKCAKAGVGNALALEMFQRLYRRGVRRAFGCIRRDEWHEKSAMNALKMAAGADSKPYTYVSFDLKNTLSELTVLGEHNGR